MHQENLWATAPMPIGVSTLLSYVPDNDHWAFSIMFHWSKSSERYVEGHISLTLENDELDVVPYLYNTAFRAWQNGTKTARIDSQVKTHLHEYRETGLACPGHVKGFKSVSFA